MKTVQGQKLVRSVERLIQAAQRGLVLVSPYFDPWEEVEDGIVDALERGVEVMIVVREGERRSEKNAEFFREHGAVVHSISHLHAKLYLNEQEGILTSLNLLVSSANTAVEMGHVIDASVDENDYRGLIRESQRLAPDLNWGDLVARRSRPQRGGKPRPRRRRIQQGQCLRCAAIIKFDLSRPFCDTHLQSWNRFKNDDYPEKFCHACGASASTSMAKPQCYSCWKIAEG